MYSRTSYRDKIEISDLFDAEPGISINFDEDDGKRVKVGWASGLGACRGVVSPGGRM